jgi:plasmid stabilization system protein ParE
VRIVVAPAAAQDLREAYEHIAKDNPSTADQVLARIVEIIGLLASGAFEGRTVTLRDGRPIQTWPVPPYRLYYRMSSEALEVVRAYHQARRPIER